MSEEERIELLETVKNLDEKKKQFILGYAAGVASANQAHDGEIQEMELKKSVNRKE